MVGLQDLPDDVLRRIFELLDLTTRCRLETLCRRFRDLLVTWPVHISGQEVPGLGMHAIRGILAQHRNVVSFSCQGMDIDELAPDLVHLLARKAPDLQELHMNFVDWSNAFDVPNALFTCLAYFPRLHTLALNGVRMEDCDISIDDNQLRSLRGLHLQAAGLCPQAVAVLLRFCKLQSLNLDDVLPLQDRDIITILTNNPDLESLLLDGDDTSSAVLPHLGALRRLRRLSISFCESFTELTPLHASEQLQWLRLRKLALCPSPRVCDLLHNLCNLTRLDLLEGVHVDDHVVAVLASRCLRLEYLVLAWCWQITDHGVQVLCRNLPQLRVLDLTGLKVLTDDCLSPLEDLACLPRLQELCFRYVNAVSNAKLLELTEGRPELVAIDYYGNSVTAVEDLDFGYFTRDIFADDLDVKIAATRAAVTRATS
ncbi:uncharacterized protein MONBRDRAFT_30941 [Monosiga brevicollis MX1]|uniref:F-box domain-containing protein n=1 Tax=Monosiga brevicollis TaxID=81824 RepID=A9UQB1_MONBE|nr:uncharacterized protein MONBRDRAFT_30941 [Monosiga brevicollis MX1]EDQ92564.1 predicted protein [Monosiga brevicollis MX1]|eukprot:XP_001742326.1 hypothetical protein [Monosiga brevicollis MX1]